MSNVSAIIEKYENPIFLYKSTPFSNMKNWLGDLKILSWAFKEDNLLGKVL